MNLRIKLSSPDMMPERQKDGDAGLDLKAAEQVILLPGEAKTVPTGVSVEIPHGYVGHVFARSGNAARHGIGLVNGVGVIDSGYRGEIKATLINLGPSAWCAERGDRIAQLVIQKVELPDIEIVDELSESERGAGGFGSTGS